jgi:hypothetical protein
MSAFLFYLALFASGAGLEWCAMRRWYGRYSLAACIFCAAIPFGILLGICWTIAIMIEMSPKDRPTFSDVVFCISIGSLPQVLIMSIFVLIPAGITAMIYQKIRGHT